MKINNVHSARFLHPIKVGASEKPFFDPKFYAITFIDTNMIEVKDLRTKESGFTTIYNLIWYKLKKELSIEKEKSSKKEKSNPKEKTTSKD